MTEHLPRLQLPAIFFTNPYIAVCFPVLVGGLIGAGTAKQAKKIYADLKQPALKPPGYVFGPVWTTIYALTGFASYLCRNSPHARTLYSYSLIWNFGSSHTRVEGGEKANTVAWTFLFFNFKRPGMALFDISALWINLAFLVQEWYKVDSRAGMIGVAYLGWVSFASYLNAGVWYLNYSRAATATVRKDQ